MPTPTATAADLFGQKKKKKKGEKRRRKSYSIAGRLPLAEKHNVTLGQQLNITRERERRCHEEMM